MELLIIVLLILINGVFSMSEAAVIASRKARLQQQAEKGNQGAQTALDLAEEPTRFLSTVQVGITLVGVLTGVFGGATIAAQLADVLRPTAIGRYAQTVAVTLVVIGTTYLTLILGELVPKRLALQYPERIAAAIARPMKMLSVIASPLITLLTGSTNAVLFLLGVRPSVEPPVTEEEIKTLMQQGIEAGIFDEGEEDMVSGIFRLGERRVFALMTPRTEVYCANLRDSEDEIRTRIKECTFSRIPVCDGDSDHVVGLIEAKTLLSHLLAGDSLDIEAVMIEPQMVPENMPASKVLDMFRESGQHLAIVIDEYGGMAGLITMQDLLEEIVGDVEENAPQATQRDDGSWLIDGLISVDDIVRLFVLDELPGAHDTFSTLGGFVMEQLGHIPQAGDSFDWTKLHFEVMDMDGNRVDKVLVSEIEPPEAPPETAPAPDTTDADTSGEGDA